MLGMIQPFSMASFRHLNWPRARREFLLLLQVGLFPAIAGSQDEVQLLGQAARHVLTPCIVDS